MRKILPAAHAPSLLVGFPKSTPRSKKIPDSPFAQLFLLEHEDFFAEYFLRLAVHQTHDARRCSEMRSTCMHGWISERACEGLLSDSRETVYRAYSLYVTPDDTFRMSPRLHLTTFKVMVIVWRLRCMEYYRNCFIYCQRATPLQWAQLTKTVHTARLVFLCFRWHDLSLCWCMFCFTLDSLVISLHVVVLA